MIESNCRYSKEKEEMISKVIETVKNNKPIICYDNSIPYREIGYLVLNPKLVNDDKVLSEKGIIYKIENCEVLKENKE